MTFSELNNIVERNDSDISFEGSGFFMAKKYGMLGKRFESIPDKILFQSVLRSVLEFNLNLFNVICDTECTFCVKIDGEDTNIRRVEHYTGKFGDKLRFTQTDYNDDTDELISTTVIYKDYDLKDNCTVTQDNINQFISKI